jgi:hypothetical protein
VRLRTIEDWGIPSGAKEAYAFALMGSITPAREPLVLPDPATRAPGHLRIEAVVCKEV